MAELTAEHDDVVRLVGLVRAGVARGDLDEVAALTRRIAEVLTPHTVVEEQGLFPELVDAFPDHVAALEADHRRTEAVLAESAAATPTDPTWPQRLLETLDDLRDHILKEQDGVFPAALAELGSEQWERVEAVRARAGSALVGGTR
ncbi:hemerythrin domain-containing protein [Thalassiella azotivora]